VTDALDALAGVPAPAAAVDLAARRIDLHAAIRDADLAVPWRVDRLAADGYVTVLAGRGGEGKSLLALALAGGVLQPDGGTVAGLRCEPGRVAIFDAENGPRLIGQRLKQAETPLDGLAIWEANGLDLARADHVAQLAHAATGHGANLIALDSLRTLAPRAAENDSDSMAPVIVGLRDLARDTRAAVLVLHHRRKDLAHDYRGSGSIHDQVDLMFVLERDETDPDRRVRRRLRCAKCRIDAEPDDRWLTVKPWRGQPTLHEAAAYEPKPRAAEQRDQLAEQIVAVLAANGPIGTRAVARRLDRPPDDRTVRRALQQLHEHREIHRGEDKRWDVSLANTTPPAPDGDQITLHDGANGRVTSADDTHDTPRTGRPVAGRRHPLRGEPRDTPTPTPDDHDQLVDEFKRAFDATENKP
jgi:hypothetical protein